MARQRPGGNLERLLKEQVDELKKLNARQASAAKGGVFGGAGAAIGATLGVPAPVAAFKALETTIGGFVQKANPAAMERFQLVLDDVTAVIGQTLAPVLEILGQAARLVGDVLASILPSGAEMKEMLAPINDLLKDLREALEPLIPILKEGLSLALKGLTLVIQALMIPIQFFIGLLEGFLGDLTEDRRKLKDSTGAAARNIRFEDPMAAVKSVYQAAFKASFGTQAKEKGPLDKINDNMTVAVDWLKNIAKDAKEYGVTIGGFLADIFKVIQGILAKIPNPVDKVEEAQDFISGAIESLIPGDIGRGIANTVTLGGGSPPSDAVGLTVPGINKIVDAIAELAKATGKKELAASSANDTSDWTKMVARRGVDGHPGMGRG